eukprot:366230-Chlamydomonas_euryale.AAC.13
MLPYSYCLLMCPKQHITTAPPAAYVAILILPPSTPPFLCFPPASSTQRSCVTPLGNGVTHDHCVLLAGFPTYLHLLSSPSPWLASLPAGPEVVGSIPASLTGAVRFRKLFPALVPSFPFRTWRSLRWGMSGLTPSDPLS